MNASALSANSALLKDKPRAGDQVIVRGRTWRVAWVTSHRDCMSLRVASDDPSVAPATFLHPYDELRQIPRRQRLKRASRRAAMLAVRQAIVHDVVPFPALLAAAQSSIDLLPYQLEPALALLAGAANRLLLADDVGLGKTIQAGLAIKELAARNEANHALLVVPAGLVDQWSDELRSRFALTTERVDAVWLRLMSRSLPPWVSPWSLPGLLLTSIDLLKRREVLSQVEHTVWDLVVIDEAHRATGATDRHRAAAHVCSRASRVVLLTATPHAGDADAFKQIQQLGSIPHDQLPALTFARTRTAVAPASLRRRVRYVRVELTREEQLMHAALDRYIGRVLRGAARSERDAVRLAMMVLKKRALSSAFSLRRSLARRLASIEEPADLPSQLGLQFDPDPAGELVTDDQEPDAVLAAGASSAAPRERDQLGRLMAMASAAAACESKLRVLRRVLARTGEPVIVFTEYRDTLEHVAMEVAPLAAPVLLHGGLSPEERRAVVSSFTHGAARVLVATDAAAEGLNLHERCRWVINLELPWAPLRLIQRAGRVDRIGQQRRVHAWHLVAEGTGETRLLLSLSTRAQAAASALDRERAVGEDAVAAALLEGAGLPRRADDPQLRVSDRPAAAAEREKRRLETIRTFSTSTRRARQTPGGLAVVKRRRGFARYSRGDVLLVISGLALDWQGCPIARRVGLGRAGSAPESNDLDSELRDDIRRCERAAAVAATRRRAVSLWLDRARPLVQPALFDRRAVASGDETVAAIARAQRQLEQEKAEASAAIQYEVVAGFRVT